MEFWTWLVQSGLIKGNPTYYSSGKATKAEYAHAIRTAINGLRTASDPRAATELYNRLKAAGAIKGDMNYYISGKAAAAEIENLVNVSAGYFDSRPAAAPAPAPKPAPKPAPAPPRPAPPPPPRPVTPNTPTPPPATNPDPGGGGGEPPPAPIDWQAKVRAYYPWLPDSLVGIFADSWATTGDATMALAEVRSSNIYNQIFPGIKRQDGTLRMSEQEWFSTREAYGTLFREYGLNPTIFEDRFTELMEGDVSASELAGRLGGAYEQILGKIPQVKEAYSQWFGAGGMTDEAIFASFIDPTIGDAILNRRISMAQVGGEGLSRGFGLNELQPLAERMVANGIDQSIARGFFQEADGNLYNFDQLAQRHRDPDDTFDLAEFADATIFGDATQTKRVQRLLRQEASLFTPQEIGQVQFDDDLALTGLSQR